MNGILRFVSVIFNILKGLIEILASIFKNVIALIVFLFKYLIEILANPSLPSVIAIAFFIFVSSVAAYQWGQIGVWIGALLNLTGVGGIAAATVGVLVGLGINIYQLAPELWKIRRDMAKAYTDLNIDPDSDLENSNSPSDRLAHWLTYDHGTLKGLRRTSYLVETGLIVAYCAIPGGMEVMAIVISAVSLAGIELGLKGVGATTNLANAVNQKMSEQEANDPDKGTYGF
ncbi:MAG: hypothetical protein KME43_11345 [Myxacorys chilensis ATA2-1-KO14]|nr:hypothetical protein [Myxacorys chilensis ATA2-1-KO14]